MKTRPPLPSPGFTLIELLTVIAIIAILMGLLFPAIGAVKENARKAQAKSDVTQIVAAVKAYYTEYGKFPPMSTGTASTSGQDEFVGDDKAKASSSNATLFNTLRSIPEAPNDEYKANPRKIVFFEGKTVSNPDAPRAGFVDKSGADAQKKGSYFDPWGFQYTVMVDSNYDNVLDMEQCYSDFAGEDRPRTAVGAFSIGKDGEIGNSEKFKGKYRDKQDVSDDLISWQ
jgi:prepilin-type N-terminal cleavage/methylation domain-containing protein